MRFLARVRSAWWAARWDWLETRDEGPTLPPAHGHDWQSMNPILDDVAWKVADGPVTHKTTIRTSLPGSNPPA